MAPPSSGGPIIAEILNIMENADIEKSGFQTPETIHIMAEAMRRAYADRSEYFGDPDFVKVPLKELTDKAYAKRLYESIDEKKATPRATIQKIDIKRARLFLTSIQKSLCSSTMKWMIFRQNQAYLICTASLAVMPMPLPPINGP